MAKTLAGKRLIGKNINGKTIVIVCANQAEVLKAYRAYGKAGIALEDYDKALAEEADRLINQPDDKPRYRF